MIKKSIFICTFLALSSGFFGWLITVQVIMTLERQKCQNQTWGFQQICNTWITPGAIWQGSTAGIWTGTILGAFVGGLIAKKSI